MSRWTIKEQSRSVEVWKDRKRVGTHDSMEQARAWIKPKVEEGDTVHHEEVDGYRTNVTRSVLPRRGWRR